MHIPSSGEIFWQREAHFTEVLQIIWVLQLTSRVSLVKSVYLPGLIQVVSGLPQSDLFQRTVSRTLVLEMLISDIFLPPTKLPLEES